jgi:superoxide dismutase
MAAALFRLRASAGSTSIGSAARAFSTQKLPDLPYDYSALEPVISAEIMEIHHSKHHATYVTNFNAATEQQAEAEQKGDASKLISLQPAIRFNGGGAYLCENLPHRNSDTASVIIEPSDAA